MQALYCGKSRTDVLPASAVCEVPPMPVPKVTFVILMKYEEYMMV